MQYILYNIYFETPFDAQYLGNDLNSIYINDCRWCNARVEIVSNLAIVRRSRSPRTHPVFRSNFCVRFQVNERKQGHSNCSPSRPSTFIRCNRCNVVCGNMSRTLMSIILSKKKKNCIYACTFSHDMRPHSEVLRLATYFFFFFADRYVINHMKKMCVFEKKISYGILSLLYYALVFYYNLFRRMKIRCKKIS